jgi:hypothetical protein
LGDLVLDRGERIPILQSATAVFFQVKDERCIIDGVVPKDPDAGVAVRHWHCLDLEQFDFTLFRRFHCSTSFVQGARSRTDNAPALDSGLVLVSDRRSNLPIDPLGHLHDTQAERWKKGISRVTIRFYQGLPGSFGRLSRSLNFFGEIYLKNVVLGLQNVIALICSSASGLGRTRLMEIEQDEATWEVTQEDWATQKNREYYVKYTGKSIRCALKQLTPEQIDNTC